MNPFLRPLILAFGAVAATAAEPGSDQHFRQYVQPVLESGCVHCHNDKEQEGGLRLDSLEAMLKGGDNGAALVPGDPDKSPVYTSACLAADHDDVMPPKKDGPPLSKGQTDVLKDWIKAGAKWPAGVVLAVQPRMQFERDVQPIFEMYCVSCHRADNPDGGAKGELDMTTLEGVLAGGDVGRGLVPFEPENSPVYSSTALGENEDDLMPPKKSGGPMKKEFVEKLRLWVVQGAPWPDGLKLKQRMKVEDRPPSPDNMELVKKIHALLVKNATEQTAADMKPYTGKVLKNPKPNNGFEMVVIPAGDYTMGSPEGEKDRRPDEGPQVKVKIEPFWMGAHEVTWDMYMPFMITPDARWKDGAKKNPKPDDTEVDAISSPTAPYTDMTFGHGQDGFPALSMTEHAANKFCQWLSAQTGQFYRLPTEAEWEYAARAGSTTAFFFGDSDKPLEEYAWFYDNSDGKPQPVGKKKPNPWGLYDIYGNVSEWCLDQYKADAFGTFTAGSTNPWTVPVKLYPRSVRGGSWDDDPKNLRSAARRGSSDDWKMLDPQLPKSIWYHTSAQFLGFRLVRPLKVPTPEEMYQFWNLGTKND